jgi:uncharacterized protein (TIGR02217 family)
VVGFHEVLFPFECASQMAGGPERRTEIVTLVSGFEQRNQRWANSRRRWNVGSAVRTYADLQAVLSFFEERRGRAYGFRVKDRADFVSAATGTTVSAVDQTIGVGDGATSAFQCIKTYGVGGLNPWVRTISKLVSGTVLVAVDGAEKTLTTHFTVDVDTGVVTFTGGNIPTGGQVVSAGFQFHVPARFDTDFLDIDLGASVPGTFVSIPIVEIKV